MGGTVALQIARWPVAAATACRESRDVRSLIIDGEPFRRRPRVSSRHREFGPGSVRRTDRLGALADIGARLVVVSAPPGYGKTTLIAEWAERDTRPFLYLRLNAWRRRPDPPGPLWNVRRTPVVVAIDDAHLLLEEHADDIIDALVDRVAVGLARRRWRRADPRTFRLGRRRADHEVCEFGTATLAFRPEEAAALVHESGLALAEAAVTALSQATDGWPAGLSLALLAVRDDADPDGAALAFSGSDRFVVGIRTRGAPRSPVRRRSAPSCGGRRYSTG